MPKRITLRQIAARCGYHVTTVSLALRDHPSIPERTRQRIRDTANEMGYRPDPVLSALVAYRNDKRQPAFAGTLIWLDIKDPQYRWQDIRLYREYAEGVRAEAEKLGYSVDEFAYDPQTMSAARASQILHSRGISGLIVPPQHHAHTRIDLPWEEFPAVSFGYSLDYPRLHVVTHNHLRIMQTLVRKLFAHGYARPGLVILRRTADRVDNKWVAAYVGESYRSGASAPAPPLLMDRWHEAAFDRWVAQEQPDVLIAGLNSLPELRPYLESRGVRVPQDIGLVDHNLADGDDAVAGMKQNGRLVGATAVQVLVGLIHRNERGIPDSRYETLINGYWFDGPTIRASSPTASGTAIADLPG